MFNMSKLLESDRKKALSSGKLKGTKKPEKKLQIMNGKTKASWNKK